MANVKLAFSVQPFKVLENPITQVRALARNRKRVKGVNASHWFVGDERIPLVYFYRPTPKYFVLIFGYYRHLVNSIAI